MSEPEKTRYFRRLDDREVRCSLCPHSCLIGVDQRGLCGVRQNQDGNLVSINYGRLVSLNSDPIEKKPLFHVLPGSRSLSIATVGCNLSCQHCQNHDISQYPIRHQEIPGRPTTPSQVVAEARRSKSATISFTYSEPTIFMEFAQDVATIAAEQGIACVSVTNGFTSPEPIRDLAPNLLGANVDLKSFDDGFYKRVCNASLKPVLATIELLKSLGVWVEVTSLLIPGQNDDPKQLKAMAEFIVSVDPAIPWHLSRFHPDNEMQMISRTPIETIDKARSIGLDAGLRFVYSGNVWGDRGENTHCPACEQMLIDRHGFAVRELNLKDGACPGCGEKIEGVWALE